MYLVGMYIYICIYIYTYIYIYIYICIYHKRMVVDMGWQGAVGFLNCHVSFEENPACVELICKRPDLYIYIADKESYPSYACGM